ncbi:MAG: TetR/AcrR family transcriptional regulator, partial [Myxococcales bacterium]|nr:TetR/AcrR family transcriptional regulator [Myxococcales bacterium]
MPSKKREQRPPPPVEIAERRRQDLLDAAFSLIAERGLEGLRTRDVAARAGVNISTLHYYFATKEKLLLAVVGYASERFARRGGGDAEGEGVAVRAGPGGRAGGAGGERERPPGVRRAPRVQPTLCAHLETAWQNFRATPELAVVLQELALRGQRDDATRAAFRALHKGWNRVVEQVLRRQIKEGALRADLDPRAAARVVTSFIIGATVQLGVNAKAF